MQGTNGMSVVDAQHVTNLALLTLPMGEQRTMLLEAIRQERLAWDVERVSYPAERTLGDDADEQPCDCHTIIEPGGDGTYSHYIPCADHAEEDESWRDEDADEPDEVRYFAVEMGVKGSYNILRHLYTTEADALDRAVRWSLSNSIGSYWAEVTDLNTGDVLIRRNI